MMHPSELLETLLKDVEKHLSKPFVADADILQKVESICRCNTNKAPIRFMLACLLAKMDRPEIDIRKPYTEIEGDDTYSGRRYDEAYITHFADLHKLPCNATTAFLTPAFRNINRTLTSDLNLEGKPKEVYAFALLLLDLIHRKNIASEPLLKEFLRILLIIREENENRMNQLLVDLKRSDDDRALSSEQILTLLEQHLWCKNSSRLPVLMVAAAYTAVEQALGEKALPLQSHNAADKQTGSLGDVEIELTDDNSLVTCYEMKDKRVSTTDINHALTKISNAGKRVDNYIFITTDLIEAEVAEYAKSMFEKTGIEIVVLGCLGFIRHYLHFFHRHRFQFLNIYQKLVLDEPNSSVGQPLKEAFLVLRKQAESN
jgi:hypothetical protein